MSKHPRTQKEQNEVQVESLFRFNFIIWLLSFTEETTADNVRLSWPHAAVLLLLATYQDHRHLFMHPTMKRVQVWKQICNAMLVHGIVFSHSNCEKKMEQFEGEVRHFVLLYKNSYKYFLPVGSQTSYS